MSFNNEVIERLRSGPSQSAVDKFRTGMCKFWHPVALEKDLMAGKMLAVRLLETPIVLTRLDGELLAMLDVCRHYQAQLSLGEVVSIDGRQAIQCPYHGWAYGQSGRCVRIPQFPKDRQIPASAALPSFKVAEKLGLIWVCLDQNPTFDLPDFTEYDDPEFRILTLADAQPINASSIRLIMGTLDDTHFPWVHEGILGDREHPEPPDHSVKREGNVLHVDYDMLQPPSLSSGATDGNWVKSTYLNQVHMPNVIKLEKITPSGRYFIWQATCPVDHCHTLNFWIFARDYDKNPERDNEYLDFSRHIREQDKVILESQRPWLLPPFWSQIEMPMRPGDKPLVEYQRWLEELGIAGEL